MNDFDIGETVICSAVVTTAAGVPTSPATSMTIAIHNEQGTEIIAPIAMTNDSTGVYHYDFASSGKKSGVYLITYTATDGTRITISKDKFILG